ncbi:patatin-like phospholipase family protein [Kordiimonas aestuarii]|uniref:patatin-like phospholipase family protein n=1 Tax=Kordiimonas aestuarii TaxID=1005925 RepID=UPI0021CF175A|nr:patatin-like phospholipase family protein [Kordiimonas aestuarii]
MGAIAGWVMPFRFMTGMLCVMGALLCALLFTGGLRADGDAGDAAPASPVTSLTSVTSMTPAQPAKLSAEKRERPKIGLVLAGGGARGGAHIGVLKVLEQLQIPVDYIAGTSFGAIVGSFYAAGYSADELEIALSQMRWDTLLSDRAPRSGRSFQRKLDDEETALDFEFSVGPDGLSLPPGLVRGNQLRLMLRRFLSRVDHIRDFDDLPIPFRAVATDLETGQEVVLGAGDIASAVLGSMSVPGLFPPLDREGRLLVDGGLVNNLPVSVVRDMGADIVILVDIGTPLADRDEITSVPKVFSQLLSLLTLKGRQAQLDLMTNEDFLLRPNVSDIGLTEFYRTTSAIPQGEKAADNAAEALKVLAVSDEEWAAHLAARVPDSRRPVIDFITVQNSSSLPDEYIRSLIRQKAGEEINEAKLSDDLTRIYGTGYFDRVEYQLLEEGGDIGIRIDAAERSVGKRFVKFGLSLSDDFAGNNNYNLAASYTVLGINDLGAEWRSRVQVGDELGAATEIYQPLDLRQRYFVTGGVGVSSVVRGITNDRGVTVADARITDGLARVGVGRNLSNVGRLTLGVDRQIARAKLQTPDFEFPAFNIHSTNFFARFEADTLDNVNFPHGGFQFELEYTDGRTVLGGESTVNKLEGLFTYTHTWGRNTLTGFTNGGFAYGGDETEADNFALGGFLNLSGLRANQISGKYYGVGGLVYYRRVNEGGIASLFGVPVYAGLSLEAGNTWNNRDDIAFRTLRYGGSLFVGADTPLGPLYLGSGYTRGQADDQFSAFMYLGQPF